VAEVSADKDYASVKNTEAVSAVGATPYIAFRTPDTGLAGGMWNKIFGSFLYRCAEFIAHYHKRSNVETTFSMIKRKFEDSVLSKAQVAMVNEALCKVLCHNLVVVIHEIHELGFEPGFWAEASAA
jgi:transposase